MIYEPEQAAHILQHVEAVFHEDRSTSYKVKKIWWMLAYFRARGLATGLSQSLKSEVAGGPFKGMKLTEKALETYHAPLLLGSYEHELHGFFEQAAQAGYKRILNIGCSVGYYAVGLALRMPTVIVDAFDINAEARADCAALAALNGVQDRVRVQGEFRGEAFADYLQDKALAVVDIEGAETALMNPDAYPALRRIDMLIEMHDTVESSTSRALVQRFTASHDIHVIPNRATLPDLAGIVPSGTYIDPFDHLLLGWECRDGPTPWGLFRVKTG